MHNELMPKDVICISEADAAGDFTRLMAHVRKGTEVIIESGKLPVAVLRAAEPARRTIYDDLP
jgi:antitoxin (DNA-binding transcriptional repressor) of toxin-antitoxin stability system